jgi:hypothetical protein
MTPHHRRSFLLPVQGELDLSVLDDLTDESTSV